MSGSFLIETTTESELPQIYKLWLARLHLIMSLY